MDSTQKKKIPRGADKARLKKRGIGGGCSQKCQTDKYFFKKTNEHT